MAAPLIKPLSVVGREVWKFGKQQARSSFDRLRENRGKFNATKKRTGKTTEELTHSKNPVTRKRAIFAQNAKKMAPQVIKDYLIIC